MILYRRLTKGITFHDALYGFREGRSTGTTTLEAKLLQQLAAMKEEVLYVIFLDLTKAYDALDRSRRLEILKGYRVWETECDGCCSNIGTGRRWWREREDIIRKALREGVQAASAACSHEGGSPIRDLPRPDQGI